MDSRDVMQELLQYWMGSRGVGHTTLLLEGANEQECVVIGANEVQARRLAAGGKARPVSIYQVGRLRGIRAPIAIDHYALQVLFGDALKERAQLEQQVEREQNYSSELEDKLRDCSNKLGDLDNGHNMLDSLGAPKDDGNGTSYSIVGRLAHWDLLQAALAQQEE